MLMGGHAEAADPLGQLSGVVERISTFAGVKLQEASSGRPEQESVTNMGAVNVDVNSTDGVTATVTVPAWPGVRVRVFAVVEAGVILEMATVYSHCVATFARIAGVEVEVA
jgi:hypothetical protein